MGCAVSKRISRWKLYDIDKGRKQAWNICRRRVPSGPENGDILIENNTPAVVEQTEQSSSHANLQNLQGNGQISNLFGSSKHRHMLHLRKKENPIASQESIQKQLQLASVGNEFAVIL